MKIFIKYLTIFLLLILTVPNVHSETTVATMDVYWSLTGEITNMYPYSVFITIPEEIEYIDKDLKTSKNFMTLTNGYEDDEEASTDNVTVDITTRSELNGKDGFWLPPYTTAKIKMYSTRYDNLITKEGEEDDEDGDEMVRTMDISGPAAYPKTKLLDLKEIIPASKKQGIKLDNFKLYVHGSIEKEDTEVLSILLPAPIVLKDYSNCDKVISKYSVNTWVDSYSDWVNEHNDLSNYGSNMLDTTLVPVFDMAPGFYNLYDIPALVYTTSSNQKLDFSYKMYWYDKEEDIQSLWML
ncbi:conserved hypothetical protein [Methanococcus maripaludis C5]|jgi:hypothetical protein|uniref:Uncharacterized protein n=1 Tax=Methanococcus maripaludis (strain C5 / ATCC BAA-1333) TaxID=402880 RepID=A4FZV2_METM5|nr:hypothetical protein [Methanococcus maripaludis]ABO35736.1 conserved hypothetical protein [Methanococcus maripaludis C5]